MSLSIWRLGFGILGVAALLWSSEAIPLSWVRLQSLSLSERILSGERFKDESLARMKRDLGKHLDASIRDGKLFQSMALLLFNFAESSAIRKGSEEADEAVLAAENGVREALSLTPQSAFLWLTLYSTRSARNGFDPADLAYISSSYASGPLEGWIALRRNRFGLAVFSSLNGETQQRVVDEFAGMVGSNFIEDAAINLIGVGWGQRERLLHGLEHVDLIERERLAKKLAVEAVKVDVPGVELDERPWR